jgi:Flp pilus assembly protein TadD
MRHASLILLTAAVLLTGTAVPVLAATAPAAALVREADRYVDEGFRLLEAGDAGNAETAFRTALSLDAREARALAGLGIASLRRGQERVAAAQFQAAVALPLPDDLAARCYANLGMIRNGQGETETAIRCVLRAVRLYPRATYEALLARIYLGARRLDEARSAAQSAQQRDPADPAVLAVAGRVANAGGRYDEAIALLKRAIQLDQDNSEIFYELGLAYLGADNLGEAERWLIGSTELNERRAGPYDALAHLFLRQHKWAQVVRVMRTKLQVDPQHHTTWPDLRMVEGQLRSGSPTVEPLP